MAATYKAAQATDASSAKTNLVYFNPADASKLESAPGKTVAPGKAYVEINNFVFSFAGNAAVAPGTIALSQVHRKLLDLSLNQGVNVVPFRTTNADIYLANLSVDVDFLAKSKKEGEFDVKDLDAALKTAFGNQFFARGQTFLADVKGNNLVFTVLETEVAQLSQISEKASSSSGSGEARGILTSQTSITFSKAPGTALKLTGADSMTAVKVFKPTFDFSTMGIGGMDEQFKNIFRRAFAPRVAPPAVLAKMGIKPVKGILLYGPPGTGKTLMARQIGQMLNGKEPTVVNGPEILDKFVGESEKKVRELFAPAEEEWKLKGAESELHVIVLDELDAICKQRGKGNTGGTGVGDTVVNQFLAKMDGYKEQNNVLLIGMTNRKELIDEALLRPGRLEVHIEIALPDEAGRVQILKIHTATMSKSGVLDPTVSLEELAARTKNFSGAELMGLVQNASTYSLNRHIDATDPTHPVDLESIKVTKQDFDRALSESKPSFGVAETNLAKAIPNGIWPYSASFKHLMAQCLMFVEQVRTSDRTPLVSLLLEGEVGSGKTALAAQLALNSKFPYVKIVSPEDLVGYSEYNKLGFINDIFENSYRSPLSLIIVDDVERLLEYVRIGPRFSNTILQGLLVLLKKIPPPGHRLLILATTANRRVLEDLEFMQVFNSVLRVPSVTGSQEIAQVLSACGFSAEDLKVTSSFSNAIIPIKKLIMLAEIAKQAATGRGTLAQQFSEVMTELGDV
jgi:vesicle-fusing ATPase